MKPRVFIGSSIESLSIANAIHANLDYDAFPTVWSQGIFGPSEYPLESLLKALEDFDFGVFVFAPDDKVQIRTQELTAVRDNVIFEMGLFVGKLGRERTFFLTPRDADNFRIPTDLFGLKALTFNAERPDKRAALGPVCEEIRAAIAETGPRRRLPETLSWLYRKAVETSDTQVHLYTFCGLQVDNQPDVPRESVIGLNSVFRLWSDPTDPGNTIQATVMLDEEPSYYRVAFNNNPGCFPGNVTLRPCGLYPMQNPERHSFLALDVRAIPQADERPNKCSRAIGLSFRVIDALATQWMKGVIDPETYRVPVNSEWHTVYVDLSKEWMLFNSDGNYYYAATHFDHSVIAALAVEFGSIGGPRLGGGFGEVEIKNIRLSKTHPHS